MRDLLITPHDLIADDAYWEGTVCDMPPDDITSRAANHDLGAKQSDDVMYGIKNLVDRARLGHNGVPIEDGETLPLTQLASSSVLRVVTDWRNIHRGVGRHIRRGELTIDDFNDRATTMTRPGKVYVGPAAEAVIARDSQGRCLTIGRYVTYYVAAPSGARLVGVLSQGINDERNRLDHANLVTPLVVGQSYGRPKRLHKVHSAEVITPKSIPLQRDGRKTAAKVHLPRAFARQFGIIPGTV